MIAPDLAGIPDFLTSLDRWVAWQNKYRGGKQTKVPKTARNTAAASTKADTWGPFETVAIALKRRPEQFDGCGIVLGDLGGGEHLCGVDLDSCLDDDGILAEWAKPFAAVLPTYGEVSPSGSGLKFFLQCLADDANAVRDAFGITDPTMWGCKRTIGANGADHGPATEVYLGPGRYFTATGKQWPQTPDEVALFDRAALLRLADLVPKPKAAANGSAGADSSRSAAAFRKGAALRRAGKTFDEMCAELRSDPDTAEWCREKGEVAGGRELRRIWDNTEDASETLEAEAEIARLAKLPLLKYAQARGPAAKALGIPVRLLEKLVKAERGDSRPEMQGEALEFPDPEHWAQAVDGFELVYDIRDLLHRHIVLPPGAVWAIAVWCLHTFLLGTTEHTPRLAVVSPERGCGKTTLLDLLGRLVFRPLLAANLTPAATFRVIARHRPSLLMVGDARAKQQHHPAGRVGHGYPS